MFNRAFIVLLVLLTVCEDGLSQRIEKAIDFDQKKNHLSFEVENDMLFQSDHYYTGGLAISYTHRKLKHTPAQFIIRSKQKKSITYTGVGIEHRLFTP